MTKWCSENHRAQTLIAKNTGYITGLVSTSRDVTGKKKCLIKTRGKHQGQHSTFQWKIEIY